MDQNRVIARLTPIFHEILDNDRIELSRTLYAGDVEEWDSLSHIRLIVAVEEAFQISFRSTEVGSLENLGDIIDLILLKLG